MDGLALCPEWTASCPRPPISLSPFPHPSLSQMDKLLDLKENALWEWSTGRKRPRHHLHEGHQWQSRSHLPRQWWEAGGH